MEAIFQQRKYKSKKKHKASHTTHAQTLLEIFSGKAISEVQASHQTDSGEEITINL